MGEVKVVHIGENDTWRTKEQLAESERVSEAYWKDITVDQRAAMLLIVREALMQLIEDPAAWVPTSIEPKNDQRLDIFVSIHLAEVDDEVVRRKLEAEKALQDATTGLVEIERDLRENTK